MKWHVGEGVMGNREVLRIGIVGPRADPGGARAEVNLEEEGGSRGKHGFPRATEPQAREHVA